LRRYTRRRATYVILLVSLWLMTAAQVPSDPDCIRQIEEPTYSEVSRTFSSEGTVIARFSIGNDGKVLRAASDSKGRLTPAGNETLSTEIQKILDRTQLSTACKGSYTLIYHFILNKDGTAEPHATVEFVAPNEFVIKANYGLMTCSVYSIDQPSLQKRFFHWLR
jgi:hypothetical protein